MKKLITLSLLLILFTISACSPAVKSLKNTAWVLNSFDGVAPVEGTTITLYFEKDSLGGTSGCNQYGGEYKKSGTKISFGALMMTEMACLDTGVMEQESAFLKALSGELPYSLEGNNLLITGANGENLVFNRQMIE